MLSYDVAICDVKFVLLLGAKSHSIRCPRDHPCHCPLSMPATQDMPYRDDMLTLVRPLFVLPRQLT